MHVWRCCCPGMEYRCIIAGDPVAEPGALVRRLLYFQLPRHEEQRRLWHSLHAVRVEEATAAALSARTLGASPSAAAAGMTISPPEGLGAASSVAAASYVLRMPNPSMPSVDITIRFVIVTDPGELAQILSNAPTTASPFSSALGRSLGSVSAAHSHLRHPHAIVLLYNPFTIHSFSRARLEWGHVLEKCQIRTVVPPSSASFPPLAGAGSFAAASAGGASAALRASSRSLPPFPARDPLSPLSPISPSEQSSEVSHSSLLLCGTRIELLRQALEATPSIARPTPSEIAEVTQRLQVKAYVEVNAYWDDTIDGLRLAIARACVGELLELPPVDFNAVFVVHQGSTNHAIADMQVDPDDDFARVGEGEWGEEWAMASEVNTTFAATEEAAVASAVVEVGSEHDNEDPHARYGGGFIPLVEESENAAKPTPHVVTFKDEQDAKLAQENAAAKPGELQKKKKKESAPTRQPSPIRSPKDAVEESSSHHTPSELSPLHGGKPHLTHALPTVVPVWDSPAGHTEEAAKPERATAWRAKKTSVWTWRQHPVTHRLYYVHRASRHTQYERPADYDGKEVPVAPSATTPETSAPATEKEAPAHGNVSPPPPPPLPPSPQQVGDVVTTAAAGALHPTSTTEVAVVEAVAAAPSVSAASAIQGTPAPPSPTPGSRASPSSSFSSPVDSTPSAQKVIPHVALPGEDSIEVEELITTQTAQQVEQRVKQAEQHVRRLRQQCAELRAQREANARMREQLSHLKTSAEAQTRAFLQEAAEKQRALEREGQQVQTALQRLRDDQRTSVATAGAEESRTTVVATEIETLLSQLESDQRQLRQREEEAADVQAQQFQATAAVTALLQQLAQLDEEELAVRRATQTATEQRDALVETGTVFQALHAQREELHARQRARLSESTKQSELLRVKLAQLRVDIADERDTVRVLKERFGVTLTVADERARATLQLQDDVRAVAALLVESAAAMRGLAKVWPRLSTVVARVEQQSQHVEQVLERQLEDVREARLAALNTRYASHDGTTAATTTTTTTIQRTPLQRSQLDSQTYARLEGEMQQCGSTLAAWRHIDQVQVQPLIEEARRVLLVVESLVHVIPSDETTTRSPLPLWGAWILRHIEAVAEAVAQCSRPAMEAALRAHNTHENGWKADTDSAPSGQSHAPNNGAVVELDTAFSAAVEQSVWDCRQQLKVVLWKCVRGGVRRQVLPSRFVDDFHKVEPLLSAQVAGGESGTTDCNPT